MLSMGTRRPRPPGLLLEASDSVDDDDLEPTLVLPATTPNAAANEPGRPHADLEARLERPFVRGPPRGRHPGDGHGSATS